ncbi:MAG: MmcQ/YjbR family DNA-binding protein [Bacteroidales bacterium]|nr:MmcQ/YjbR family DNA-binding protein [Bacteroidales bacterium]
MTNLFFNLDLEIHTTSAVLYELYYEQQQILKAYQSVERLTVHNLQEQDFIEIYSGKYPDIVPGYYLNKIHWSSMDLSGNIPEDVLRQMLDCSYNLIFHSLSKKVQAEILNQ